MRNELNHGDAVISGSELENSAGKRRIGVDAYNSAAFSTDRFGKMGDAVSLQVDLLDDVLLTIFSSENRQFFNIYDLW